MDRFIFIRGIRFLFDRYLRVCGEEIFIVKRNMADDAETVCNNAEFEDIAEMPIDIELFDLRIGRSGGGHGAIGSLIRVIVPVKPIGFSIGFQLPDDTVGILGFVFPDKGLNTGGIKDGHVSFGRVDRLTDRFREINQP